MRAIRRRARFTASQASEAMKIEVVSCSDVPLPKDTRPKDLDILVTYSMAYPEVKVR